MGGLQLLFSKGYVFVKNVRFDTFYVHESFDGFSRIKTSKFKQVSAKQA